MPTSSGGTRNKISFPLVTKLKLFPIVLPKERSQAQYVSADKPQSTSQAEGNEPLRSVSPG
jgi:hypothetical protein